MSSVHFDFTVTLGNIITVLMLGGTVWRVEGLIRRFATEHEILIRDYCVRHGLKLSDLPTRFRLRRG